jgi:hypothetical protein
MKTQRLSRETLKKIGDIIIENPDKSNKEIADIIQKTLQVTYTADNVKSKRYRMGHKSPEFVVPPTITKAPKQKFEVHENYVYNTVTKTVITDLGEFGDFVCSLDMHKAIQRAYVDTYEGKGDTASIVAMRFNFPHAKAVYKYAKIHGFTKSSIPQTDLEIAEGLSVEDAVEENIQAFKRKTFKETEKKKWALQQKYADNWLNFHHSVLKSLENHLEVFLPTYKIPLLRLPKKKNKTAVVIGISDVHYMKFCFDALGNATYNREIAIERLHTAIASLIEKITRHGIPEKIFLPVGSDNLHVDNQIHTTTKGTLQVSATDGHWALELKNYIEMTLNMIDIFSQVAPVVVIPTAGNHDQNTSYMLNAYLSIHYRKSKRVTFQECHHARVYTQYGSNCFIFGHFEDLSEKKIQANAHKFIMQEAKENGINAERYFIFSQHIHTDSFKALGAHVQHFVFPSLSGTDQWHRNNAYFGTSEATAYSFNDKGKDCIFYA